MRMDFFCIPVRDGAEETSALNALLNSARVLSVDREFVADGANSFWSICVQHQTTNQRGSVTGRKQQVDYRDVLSPEDFAVFVRLRELRKQIATEEAIPPYSVFTNEQLAQMVQNRVSTQAQLKDIDGVGEARTTKYGARFLSVLSGAKQPTQTSS